MIWKIPVTWMMTGTQEIAAGSLEEAMAHACDSFNATDGEFKEGSLELDCADAEIVRSVYNHNRPDYLESVYPELGDYSIDGHSLEIPWCDDGSEGAAEREDRMIRGMGQYRVVFVVGEERFYCTIEALSLAEALGVFFREHPHITYDMIVDHTEV